MVWCVSEVVINTPIGRPPTQLCVSNRKTLQLCLSILLEASMKHISPLYLWRVCTRCINGVQIAITTCLSSVTETAIPGVSKAALYCCVSSSRLCSMSSPEAWPYWSANNFVYSLWKQSHEIHKRYNLSHMLCNGIYKNFARSCQIYCTWMINWGDGIAVYSRQYFIHLNTTWWFSNCHQTWTKITRLSCIKIYKLGGCMMEWMQNGAAIGLHGSAISNTLYYPYFGSKLSHYLQQKPMSGHTALSAAALKYSAPCFSCSSYLSASNAVVGPYFLLKRSVSFSCVSLETSLYFRASAHMMGWLWFPRMNTMVGNSGRCLSVWFLYKCD